MENAKLMSHKNKWRQMNATVKERKDKEKEFFFNDEQWMPTEK